MAFDPKSSGLTVQPHFSTLKTDPIRSFKYLVQINHDVVSPDGNTTATIGFNLGFTSVSGFSAQTAPIPYRAGGMNTTPQMLPGQTSFNPISCTRGVLLGTYQNWSWFKQLFAVNVGTGAYSSQAAGDFRGSVDVWVLPHPQTDSSQLKPVFHYKVYNAWPSTVAYSDLNAGDNAYIVENMVLQHEGWEPEYLG